MQYAVHYSVHCLYCFPHSSFSVVPLSCQISQEVAEQLVIPPSS
jgi:hypothetical protein